MTYIVGGKLDNRPFLMIDCKQENQNGQFLFADKVVSFNSHESEAYFCQMGHGIVKHFITMIDYSLTFEERKINLFDVRDIRWVFDTINEAIQYSKYEFTSKDHCLFFISKDNICKYTVLFDNKERRYHHVSQYTIENNQCYSSNSPACRQVNVQESDLEEFCKVVIEEEKAGIVDDLKDRYTYIYSDGEKLKYQYPFKSKRDVFNMFTSMGFDKLD
jgi:hypothetical protein